MLAYLLLSRTNDNEISLENDSQKTPQAYLLQEVETSIQTLKNKVNRQKRNTQLINALSIFLGTLITVTLGLTLEGFEELQRNIALGIGALLTVVNGWGALFDYKKFWFRQKSTLLELYQLRNEINFYLLLNQTPDDKWEDLFEQYKSIWEENGSEWRNIVRTVKTPHIIPAILNNES